MSVKAQKEYYVHVDIDNTIIELKESYLPQSVVAEVVTPVDIVIRQINITEIGQKYVQLNDPLSLNEKVRIRYNIESLDYDVDTNVLDRLNKLEVLVNDQNKVIETLIAAMNNRVDKHTFNVWLKAVEHRFGKPILEHNLVGVQAVHIGDRD